MITVFVFSTDASGKQKVRVEHTKAQKVTVVPVNKSDVVSVPKSDKNKVKSVRYVQGGHVVKVPEPKVKLQCNPVDDNPRVTFLYPSSDGFGIVRGMYHRDVRVISANSTHLIGLQLNDKNRFKKFRRDRIENLQLVEFAPASMG